jgi:DNA helicase HerA-like ATPase
MESTPTRVREHIGIVTNDTSTTHINFLITPLKNKISVEKTDYIMLDHPTQGENNPILAEVTEVKGYEESAGTGTNGKTAGNLIATANIIGYINLQQQNRPIQKLLTPPNPGSRIYLPYAELLEDTFKRDIEGKPYATPIHIGIMEAAATTKDNKKPLNYYLNAETLTTTHTLITGTAGTGKTQLANAIITEIANKTQHAIVVIDQHGEYKTLQQNTKTTTLNPTKTTTEQETKHALTKTIKPNQTTILNAEDITPEEKHNTLTQYLAALWKTRQEKTTPPFLLIIEDAETLKNQTLEALAYEGTKHGIALILIAKHPTELGGKILSQMTTQIMGRTTDKDDLDYFKNMAMEKTALLPQLKQGEWIINSITTTRPIQVRVKQG